jgi:hypothetical protein
MILLGQALTPPSLKVLSDVEFIQDSLSYLVCDKVQTAYAADHNPAKCRRIQVHCFLKPTFISKSLFIRGITKTKIKPQHFRAATVLQKAKEKKGAKFVLSELRQITRGSQMKRVTKHRTTPVRSGLPLNVHDNSPEPSMSGGKLKTAAVLLVAPQCCAKLAVIRLSRNGLGIPQEFRNLFLLGETANGDLAGKIIFENTAHFGKPAAVANAREEITVSRWDSQTIVDI